MLWSTSEIPELNEAYSVRDVLPNVVLVGSNGGGTGYGIEWDGTTCRYIAVPFIGMEADEVEPLAGSLTELIERIRAGDRRRACGAGRSGV